MGYIGKLLGRHTRSAAIDGHPVPVLRLAGNLEATGGDKSLE